MSLINSALQEFEDSKSKHPFTTATEAVDSTALLEEGGGRESPSGRAESRTMQTLRGVRALRRKSYSDIADMSSVLNEIAKAQVEKALFRVSCPRVLVTLAVE